MGAIITGLIRHGLTAIGGGLMTNGYVEGGDIEIVTGALVALGGVVWSAISKYRAKKTLVEAKK